MIQRLSIFAIFYLHAALLFAQSSLSNKQTLVIATYQYGENARIENIKPFAEHFGSVAEVSIEVKSYPTVQILLQAMIKGEVDIAFMNTFGYLLLREQTSAYEISAALHLPTSAASIYTSIIVANAKNKIRSIDHIKDVSEDNMVAFVNAGSTSGNLLPRLKLASLLPDDPEKFFVEVHYATRHNLAMEEALHDEYTIAAFGSEEYYKLGADTVQLKKLWESPPIPLGPVVCKKNLPSSLRTALQETLLELHQQNIAAFEAIKAGWTEAKPADEFIQVDDSYYDALINLTGDRERAMKIIRRFAK